MTTHETGIAPIGNGVLLAYLEGAAIQSLHCGYRTPSILSLSPELSGGYYESTSRRMAKDAFCHRLCYSPERLRSDEGDRSDLQVTDRMATRGAILLRTLEGDRPFCFRIQLPTYVRGEVIERYTLLHTEADALFCTLPAGMPYEGGETVKEEICLAIYLCGDLHFEADGRTVTFEGGVGHMLFIECSDPTESLNIADALIASLQAGRDPAELDCFAKEGEGARDETHPAIVEETAAALLAMQAEEGYILGDTWHPYANASALPLLTAALLRLGHREEAERMLDYHAAQIDASHEQGGESAAFLLAALLCLEAEPDVGDPDRDETRCRRMRKAFSHLMQAIGHQVLPFSGDELCFEAGILSRDSIFHGSAIATAMALAAFERYFRYCERIGCKIARESAHYLELYTAAVDGFERHFGGEGLYRLNSPALEERIRRPRFMRGVCPSCSASPDNPFPMIEPLELDRTGRYRCRRCLARANASEEAVGGKRTPLPTVESIDATAAVALWMPSPFRERALARAERFYRSALEEGRALPLRSAACDAMLCAAAKQSGSADESLFRRALLDSLSSDESFDLEEGALPRALVEGSEMKGAICSSEALAALILALT